MTIIIILTILNTLAIIYLFVAKSSTLYIEFRKDKTDFVNTLVGYEIILWKKINDISSKGICSLYIPIRNKQKIELKEEIECLIRPGNPNVRYTLHAKFSWLKTQKEVDQFKKDYLIVDKDIVEKLVASFKPTK